MFARRSKTENNVINLYYRTDLNNNHIIYQVRDKEATVKLLERFIRKIDEDMLIHLQDIDNKDRHLTHKEKFNDRLYSTKHIVNDTV